ncbi:signal peptide peptidase SppA [Leptotrichia buccalis]|jgi:signal peptide peptidase sppA, 67K type|uniref:Signal peptide peptidase SppA, 67K type n=1 Tax=Leptotrichia buccalis (strain ATCC 14201 / DSM 1135 / JCM 12969 / NCTC 10249 / C-1013-b) TaxID=523794 RepID=C7NEJ2_LEPBD|nr:signal peptide peptidase SppA [Leptotrichia buccalis]ACV38353.1 signal peptide peptidase SppA, 67K type [Leptotrichia buccalis C-1013-b]
MKFLDFLKKFLIFSLKEIYSFFLKMSLFIFVIFIIGISAIAIFSSKDKNEKMKKSYEYILFNVSDVTEDKIVGSNFLSDEKLSYMDILNSLDDIKNNNQVKGVVIALDTINLSSAKIEELIKKFEELKANNKKVYAFGAYITNSNYKLASIADEVVMVPSASASLDLTGYHYSDLYYKGLFDKIGVNMEVVRIGNYKSYGEEYIGNDMTPELRSELTRILENRYNKFITDVAKNRKVDKNALNNDIVNGNITNLTPFSARDKGLVDKLEQFSTFTERLNIREDNIADITDYYQKRVQYEKTGNSRNGTIAVIYAEGSILYDANGVTEGTITPDNILQKIEKATQTKNLKGIVLRVNSGGGSALASEVIYQELSKLKIPVYVSMADTAASGGYYISTAGKKVFANSATITGSIGVVSMLPKLYNAQDKYGVRSNSISKGRYSDINDSFAPLSEESRAKISQSMEETYKEFKSRVSKNRKIDENTLENYAQGKIWLGDEAKDIKLVDGIASLDEVIKIMAKDLNLRKNYAVENIYLEEDFSQKLKSLSNMITAKFNLSAQLEKSIPQAKKAFNEYDFAMQNQNKPLYYLTYKLNLY